MPRLSFLAAAFVVSAASGQAARADSIATLAALQDANRQLDDCLDANLPPGPVKADAGSKARLNALCSAQRDTAVQACIANNSPASSCTKQESSRADALLSLKQAGIQ